MKYLLTMGVAVLLFIFANEAIDRVATHLPGGEADVFYGLATGSVLITVSALLFFFSRPLQKMQTEWIIAKFHGKWKIPLFFRIFGARDYTTFALYNNILMMVIFFSFGMLLLFGGFISVHR